MTRLRQASAWRANGECEWKDEQRININAAGNAGFSF
jgi:hypothetical protein